ncbi:MAG: HIT domain-containing protein, partial [Nanoarchaeota archaeon]|nr:HIT domain-containing protein [Nanoarchaeota archaeon]
GHTLVIPKKHYKNLFDMPEEELNDYLMVIQRVSKAIIKGVNADGININMSNESAAGQVVMHTHFHLIPRFKDDGLKLWPQGKYAEGEAEEIKDKITNCLESSD